MAFFFKSKSKEIDQDISKSIDMSSQCVFTDAQNPAESSLDLHCAMQYYSSIAPFYNSINLISSASSTIPFIIENTDTREHIHQDPILELLNFPNFQTGGKEFLTQLSSYYKITGNVFIVATGKIDFDNFENSRTDSLEVISPQDITLNQIGGISEFTESITIGSRGWTFKRRTIQKRARFFMQDDKEIYHIRDFSDYYSHNGLLPGFGLSPANAIASELEQYKVANQHNLSMLGQSAMPSLIVKPDTRLSDDNLARLYEQLKKFIQGALNKGKAIVIPHSIDVTVVPKNVVDMDYSELRSWGSKQIYNVYNIPLPFVMAETMTLANREMAKLDFYDNAVLPTRNRMDHELTLFLMPRFKKDWINFKLTYNPTEIEALQPRRNETLKLRKEIGINSLNEMRSFSGDIPVNGGNVILGDANQLPIASVPTEEDSGLSQSAEETLLRLVDGEGKSIFKRSDLY